MFVFNTLAPVFLIIALGAALLKAGFLTAELSKGINRVAYWVALPALLFQTTAAATFSGGEGRLTMTLLGALFVAAGIALGIALLLHLSPRGAGTFVHVTMRGNVSFVGIPVVFYVIEAANPSRATELRSVAILALTPMLLAQNVLGIIAELAGQQSPGIHLFRRIARSVFHPLLIAVLLGLVASYAGWHPPVAIARTLDSLASVALPVALLGIGASLMTARIRGNRRAAFLAALLKLVAMPLAGVAIGVALSLRREELLFALVYLACPTGSAAYTVCLEMGGDEALAATTVVLSTVMAVAPLSAIVAWFS